MEDRGHLTTEHRNPKTTYLDRMPAGDIFDVINGEDATIAAAVAAARADILEAVDLVVAAFRRGGRLIYVGAGTSGRLGVLDAAECPPTFLSDPEMVEAVIAGGAQALTRSVEGAEDRAADGASAMDVRAAGPADVVLGIATGGTTPFVHGALARARRRGAGTVFLACVSKAHVVDEADVSIRVLTGPEVLTGSTRMKAGTATKMVLNTISTIAMVRIGKTFENLMVDVKSGANAKLVDRGLRIIQTVTGSSRVQARELLESARGHVKTALVMHARRIDRARAEELLAACEGHVGRVIEPTAMAT